jgi:hypothetical protein
MIYYCFRLRSFPAACGDGLPRRCLQANSFDHATGNVPIRLLQETGASPPSRSPGPGQYCGVGTQLKSPSQSWAQGPVGVGGRHRQLLLLLLLLLVLL